MPDRPVEQPTAEALTDEVRHKAKVGELDVGLLAAIELG
jgi:hypothetical protein